MPKCHHNHRFKEGGLTADAIDDNGWSVYGWALTSTTRLARLHPQLFMVLTMRDFGEDYNHSQT